MLNDTLSNAMSIIMNAEQKSKLKCEIKPVSKVIKSVLDIMKDKQYVGDYEIKEDGKGGYIVLNLLGHINKCGSIKPRSSVKVENYEKYEKRYLPSKELGMLIVSTNKGIMTHNDAKSKNMGARLLAYCY